MDCRTYAITQEGPRDLVQMLHPLRSKQLIGQRFRIDQFGGIESLGEPAVDRSEKVATI